MKTWIVIPAMSVAGAGAAILVTRDPFAVAAAGAAGAALAAAARALMGDAPSTNRGMVVAASLAPLLCIALLAEHGMIDVVSCVALAAIAWTIAELARPARAHSSGARASRESAAPLVAMLPATIAGILEPAAIALIPIAATRLVPRGDGDRASADGAVSRAGASSRSKAGAHAMWAVVVPLAGVLAVMLAIVAGVARGGLFAALGEHWFGPFASTTPRELAFHTGDALGPITAVAALAGIVLVARLRLAAVALLSCAVGALLVDLRSGTVGAATLGIAALCAAFAIGRFASTIRLLPIQTIAGATAAMMLLVPPAWTVVESLR